MDEVQFFRGWPIFVKAHHETKKARFVITGSNANMLSTDMITMLSGRSIPLEVFPFSFRELTHFRGIAIDDSIAIARNVPALKRLLDDILEYGGFPTVALTEKYALAFEILGAHARTVLLQDVAPRLGLRKPLDLEQLYVYLVSNIGKLFSYSSLSKLFGLSDKSIKEYIISLSEAHLVYEIEHFSFSLKKQIRHQKKIYAIDTGQANAMGFRFSSNRGRLLENLIFIDFCRLDLKPYYYKTSKDQEIDFVIKHGNNFALVQVAWDINNPQTLERELNALRQGIKELNCTKAIIIVADMPLNPQIDEQIICIPAYKFLAYNQTERIQFIFC